MEYKPIFSDSRNYDEEVNFRVFVEITLYQPDDYLAPYLVHITHGDRWKESWNGTWEVLEETDRAKAIRTVINKLDNYQWTESDLALIKYQTMTQPRTGEN